MIEQSRHPIRHRAANGFCRSRPHAPRLSARLRTAAAGDPAKCVGGGRSLNNGRSCNAKGPQFEEIEYWRQRGRILDQGTGLANEPARICTLLPSSISTGGLSTTWSPCLMPSLISSAARRTVPSGCDAVTRCRRSPLSSLLAFAPHAKAKGADPNRASRGAAYPGEIIPEWRAKSSWKAERDQIGMVGDIIADSRATSPGIRTAEPGDLRDKHNVRDIGGKPPLRVRQHASFRSIIAVWPGVG